MNDSYAAAGVDLEAGYEGVRRIRRHVRRTVIPGVLSDIGGFGGVFAPDTAGMKEPVLVSGADGVGTKQRVAQLMGRHDTVGIDCVAMCANDIVCCGAKPLFFLDYIAIGKNDPATVEALVSGVAEGCVRAGCALLGGETAEHPGVMTDYDLAGFAVGLAERAALLDGSAACPGDVVLALPSSGLHSNGFSLARKVFDVERADLGRVWDELGMPLGDALLTPTRIYVKAVLSAMEQSEVRGVSHITGGGFYENLPRVLPDGLCARIEKAALPSLPIFPLLQRLGGIPEREMYNTFNMGVGMALIVSRDTADKATRALREAGEEPIAIGEIVRGEEKVVML